MTLNRQEQVETYRRMLDVRKFELECVCPWLFLECSPPLHSSF